MPVLLFGSGSWYLTDSILSELESFQCDIGRKLLRLSCFHSNISVRIGLDWPSVRARVLFRKLSNLKKLVSGSERKLSIQVFRAFAGTDISHLTVIQQCRFLEEAYKTDITGPSLLGHDWLQKIRLDWQALHHLWTAPPTNLQTILDGHKEVFKDELGCVKGITATIAIDQQARPWFCKPSTVPFALREKVVQELFRLEKAGVIESVQFSKWAAPTCTEGGGSLHICGDYKVRLIVSRDNLFASLCGGKAFSKLDLAHAYQQLEVDEESKKRMVINTHKGLFRYICLPFGVSAAPAIFQQTIEGVLQGISNVCVYLDDILITGRTEKELWRTWIGSSLD